MVEEHIRGLCRKSIEELSMNHKSSIILNLDYSIKDPKELLSRSLKTLKAVAEIPEKQRSNAVKQTIKNGAEYFLIHHVFKSSHNLTRVPKPGWLKFGFPLMYQTDVLEILGILTKLGYNDKRMREAIDLMIFS
jgi:hypothetical protein